MKKNTPIIFVIAFIFLRFVAFAQEDSPYFKTMGEADKAISEHRWSDAEDLLLSILRTEPGNPSNALVLSNLGMVRYYQGKDSLALDALNLANEKAPSSVTVLSNRATVLRSLGFDNDAYADYTKILQIDTINSDALFYHGMIALYSLSDSVTAINDFSKLKKIDSESEKSLIAQTAIHKMKGNYNDAISVYTKLIEKEPSVEYYLERALCYIMLQRYNDASADVNEGLKLNPNEGELYLYRAYLNKIRYRKEDAVKDSKRAIELGVDPIKVSALMR